MEMFQKKMTETEIWSGFFYLEWEGKVCTFICKVKSCPVQARVKLACSRFTKNTQPLMSKKKDMNCHI